MTDNGTIATLRKLGRAVASEIAAGIRWVVQWVMHVRPRPISTVFANKAVAQFLLGMG